MARRQAPPKPEELIQKLEEKLNEFKDEISIKLDEQLKTNEEAKTGLDEIKEKQGVECEQLKESVDSLNGTIVAELGKEIERCDEAVDKSRSELSALIDEKIDALKRELTETIEKMSEQVAVVEKTNSASLSDFKLSIEEKIENMEKSLQLEIRNITGQVDAESSNNEGTKGQIQTLFARIDDINEKMYEFETNKKNNLIFYGIHGEQRETPTNLMMKIVTILKQTLSLRREITVSKVSRMMTGPEVSGCRPVLVTFEDFNDRENVLRKAGMLRGSNIHVTEDMSRRVRESRVELRKFLRELKKNSPSAVCSLQYDKLYVNHRCYVWSDIQGRVVEYSPGEEGLERSFSSRSLSPTKTQGSLSPLPKSPSLNMDDMSDYKDVKIKELEDTIKLLMEKLAVCGGGEENVEENVEENGVNNHDEALEEFE